MRRLTPMFLLLTVCLLALAACTGGAPAAPSTSGLTGSVVIAHPQEGSVIYAELLYAQGTADGVSAFTLDLVGADDVVLKSVPVTVTDGVWRVEFPHDYTGVPIEVLLVARPPDGTSAPSGATYAARTLALAGAQYRPDGTFGSILSPADGSSVGGELLLVTGTASGLFENTLTVALFRPDDSIISQQTVPVFNPYFIDAAGWFAELATGGYVGAAQIRAFYQRADDGTTVVLARVNVVIGEAAG